MYTIEFGIILSVILSSTFFWNILAGAVPKMHTFFALISLLIKATELKSRFCQHCNIRDFNSMFCMMKLTSHMSQNGQKWFSDYCKYCHMKVTTPWVVGNGFIGH
jgi:hypothetical protein